MTTPTKRAALYLRQSLDRAEGIEAQRKRCTDLASAKEWPIVATFTDNEVRASGERGEGTGWHDMLGRIGHDFEVIVAVDLDRLVRSTKDLNRLVDLGAQVVTVDGEIDLASADGEFRATMIAGIGRFETRRASERQKRHKAAKAERGEWHGGTPPYGYQVVDGRLVSQSSEVERIKEAARRLLELREPLHAIITDWNNQGVQTRKDKHWRQSNLRAILMNRSLLGETKAGVIGWEPIIDAEMFDRLVALLSDPARKVVHSPGVKGGKYSMGGGLTVCGKCGKPLITNIKTGRAEHVALACLARVHGPSQHHPRVEREVTRGGEKVKVWQDTGRVAVGHDRLEAYVFEQAIARLNDDSYWRKRKSEKDPNAERKIRALNNQREKLAGRRVRVLEMFEDGDINRAERRDRLDAIEAEAELIGKNIEKLVGAPDIEKAFGTRDRLLAAWPEWTPGQRRAFLRLLIDRVVVDEWPVGIAHYRPRRRGEPAEEYAIEREARLRHALEARVKIEWRD
jgi:site-specific DNA recombinase